MRSCMQTLAHYQLFLCLQVLDLLTTLVGLRLGLQEVSPFVRHLMRVHPAVGPVASKLIATLPGGYSLWA